MVTWLWGFNRRGDGSQRPGERPCLVHVRESVVLRVHAELLRGEAAQVEFETNV